MNIQPIPAFDDNYIWLFQAPDSRNAYVVDPGDAAVVETALAEMDLELAGILVTHHHFDHTGGIAQLLNNRDIPVFGSANSLCDQVTRPLHEGDKVDLGAGLSFKVLEVPGHTLDHIAFYSEEHKVLFCGDTLFVAGCGRLFEGTAEQMWNSLQKLSDLPGDTQVFCTHEYTLGNFGFASAVEPENPDIQRAIANAQSLRSNNQPTVPSTIAAELLHNPFMRAKDPAVIRAASERLETEKNLTETEVFAAIRAWKDVF